MPMNQIFRKDVLNDTCMTENAQTLTINIDSEERMIHKAFTFHKLHIVSYL